MKKIIGLFFMAMVATIMFGVYSSMAATTTVTNCSDVAGLDIKTSANVICKYISNDTGTSYGVASAHLQGNREYGASNNSEIIYYTDHTAGSSSITNPTADGTFVSGWTELGK